MFKKLTAAFALSAICATVLAANPQLGGPMKHMLVTLNGSSIGVTLEGDPLERLWLRDYGQTYTPPANVLNGVHYNGQYGWLAGGFISLPAGSAIWAEIVDVTPGLRIYEAITYAPLWGTAGASLRWKWNGVMVHNWYAADSCGKYEATYRVYVGDSLSGAPIAGYSPGYVTLLWQYVPETDLGDLDGDGDVDLHDLAWVQACGTGPGLSEMPPICGCADFNGDDDVDSADALIAFANVTGPGLQ